MSDFPKDRAINECQQLIKNLWKEAQKTVDRQWGGVSMAPIFEVLLEFDKLRVRALKNPVINEMVTSVEEFSSGSSGFLFVLPYDLMNSGKLIPYEITDELYLPPDETIH